MYRMKNMIVSAHTFGDSASIRVGRAYEYATMRNPTNNCTGITQLRRRPNHGTWNQSTIGAHSNLMEYGHETNENSACCRMDTFPCRWSSSGMEFASPIGMPCSVYNSNSVAMLHASLRRLGRVAATAMP